MEKITSFNPFASLKTAFGTLAAVIVGLTYVLLLVDDPRVFVQTIAKALGLGAVYALVALGFVLIFKATQVVNFAQGALAMIGALFVSFMVRDGNFPLIPKPTFENGFNLEPLGHPLADMEPSWLLWVIAVVIALALMAVFGLVVERLVIRPMVGQPLFSVAVITLGLETTLRIMATDTVEAQQRSLDVPWGTRGFEVLTNSDGESAFIAWSYVAAIATCAVAFVAIFFFFRSRLGVAMRAVAYDQEAAMVQGINVGRVFAIAWAIGAVLAAVGGIFATQPPIAQTGSVQVETQFIAFRSLPAVILGGLDSVQGALLGGLIVGMAEITAGQYLSGYSGTLGAGYPLIVPYVVMIIGLLVRPYGIFGTPEIRRV